ncbi:hypothetical protein CCACVL1_12249 [Corchorus capsularis]|uniref:Uncharacterized protein n=1 Tax=Corchorus capsularis TaxID=210143 RepID=A0A1R3IGN0_COCAP|nr:hypothetical protein CCACVL1_12249 [Corchorus capsularis]
MGLSDSCEAPHVFFLESVNNVSIGSNNQVLTTYKRAANRNMPPYSSSGNHSADPIIQIHVLSPATRRKEAAKVECFNVEYVAGLNVADINGEVVA